MPLTYSYKKGKTSEKVENHGPDAREQLLAMAYGNYWTVLNSSKINCGHDKKLTNRANAFKHCLQTFGPFDKDKLPDFRDNKGSAEGEVYHGHVNDKDGNTYVLEWTVIDLDKKIMSLLGFDSHENYPFAQKPLKPEQKKNILESDESKKIFLLVEDNIKAAKKKVDKIKKNYKSF